jgi:thiol-disulfide isomerase/thioredoxin
MRASILLGVLAGIVVCGLALVALIAFLPNEPLGVNVPTPTLSLPVTPSPSVTGSVAPSASATTSPAPGGSSPPVGLQVGQQAPPLSVEQLGGGQVDLSGLRGRPVWINFMATWCPPCRDELPLMARFSEQLGDEMPVIAIDVKEDSDTVATFMSGLGVSLPVGLDTDAAAQQAWSAYALPVHYWIDAEGIVRGFAYGGVGPDQFIAGVRSVLPDAQLEP